MAKIKGKLFAAIWTPTDLEGNLLKKEIAAHVEFLIQKKVDGLLIAGSTGEFLYLNIKVRKELLKVIYYLGSSLEIMYNVSHPDIKQAEALTMFANNFPIK